MRRTNPRLPALLFALATGLPNPAHGQADDIFARRDEWQRTSDMIAALGDVRGRTIADIAAGTGYLTKALSKQVGPSGRVYAVEIGEKELTALRAIAARDSFANVKVVAGGETDTKLAATVDGAIVLNSYHEIAQIQPILASVFRALRPGGSLVLVDNNPFDEWRSETRGFQASHHALDPAIVEREVRAAGFEIVRRDNNFITTPISQWLVVARRPPH